METPFAEADQLNCNLQLLENAESGSFVIGPADDSERTLPGQPRIGLCSSTLITHVMDDLCTPVLDRFSQKLWLVATQSSSHISSLHAQILKGRAIVITENPGLHCVWLNNRVFIKPIPHYLLSHAFWEFYLISRSSPFLAHRDGVRKAALGFLRTYFYLIRHESDFRIAIKEHLIPQSTTWKDFNSFIGGFESVLDAEVSLRYNRYGDLRLTRLNFWSKIFLQRFNYHTVHGQYADYFASFYGPLLFVFGIFSVLLNAMQVILTAEQIPGGLLAWPAFSIFARRFSIVAIGSVCLPAASLFLLLVGMLLRELVFALTDLSKTRTVKTVSNG